MIFSDSGGHLWEPAPDSPFWQRLPDPAGWQLEATLTCGRWLSGSNDATAPVQSDAVAFARPTRPWLQRVGMVMSGRFSFSPVSASVTSIIMNENLRLVTTDDRQSRTNGPGS